MKNAPHIIILLGRIFGTIGLWGTVAMIVVFFVLPPERRSIVFCVSVFPFFLIFGLILQTISIKGVTKPSNILRKGIKTQAKFTRIMWYGSRPVRARSIYGAEVELNINGQKILSKVFFYGADYIKVKCMMKAQQPVDVLFLASHPNRVLFANEG